MTQTAEKNIAAHLLFHKAAHWPDKTALICRNQYISYSEITRLACNMGNMLSARGVKPGERIMIAMPDCVSLFAVFLGAVLVGVRPVLVNDRLVLKDFTSYALDCTPRLIIGFPGHVSLRAASELGIAGLPLDDDLLAAVTAGHSGTLEPYPPAEVEECLVFYTSGTTGHPKGIAHTHGDCFAVAKATGLDFMGYRHDDISLCSAKIYHAYGMFVSLLNPFTVGASVVLDPEKPSVETTLNLIERHRVTIFASSPVMFGMLAMSLTDRQRIASLRYCISAGEALPSAVYLKWKDQLGMEIRQGYGSSETMTMVIGNQPPNIEPGTAGRVLPPYEAVILDKDGRPAPEGALGEIALRGPSLMRGYLNAPQWTAKVFTKDGWLLTGDTGKQEGGVFTVLGRKDDMFKVGGLWVSPTRVENVLLKHPAVAQCAVVSGSVGPYTLVQAHVVLSPGLVDNEEMKHSLRQHALAELPDYMSPQEIVFHDSLPLTASGKIQRYKLRQK